MTKLLVSINNDLGFDVAVAACADIIDFTGIEGTKFITGSAALKDADQGKACPDFMLTVSSEIFKADCKPALIDRVDMVRVQLEANDLPLCLKDLEKLARYKPTILSFDVMTATNDIFLDMSSWAEAGLHGVMLESRGQSGQLTKVWPMVELGLFIERAHRAGLVSALVGGLEVPDIPRLLPFSADILGFDSRQLVVAGAIDDKVCQLIRSLIPYTQDEYENSDGVDLGTDRILVRDFVMPMYIGAYKHEHGRLQNVRFSVSADVARMSINPEDMRHIFSYDLIIDGIRRLVSLGHVDLVETLAERIAAFILGYPRVQRVIVRVEKLDLGPGAVGIEIERNKKNARS